MRYNIAPQRAVYIDDSPQNVAAAAEIGFHPLQFVDAPRLRRDLAGFGLPVGSQQKAI
jgi:2-haloacid dehalogenase